MSSPHAENGSRKKRSKKAAPWPLIRAIGATHSSRSNPTRNPERQEKRKGPAPDSAPFAMPTVRFGVLTPRVLLSGDVNPRALTIVGAIRVQGKQHSYAFTVQESRRVVFDSLTNRSDMTWTLERPAGPVTSCSVNHTDYYASSAAFELAAFIAHAVHRRDAHLLPVCISLVKRFTRRLSSIC
jgi:hypothetical protein